MAPESLQRLIFCHFRARARKWSQDAEFEYEYREPEFKYEYHAPELSIMHKLAYYAPNSDTLPGAPE